MIFAPLGMVCVCVCYSECVFPNIWVVCRAAHMQVMLHMRKKDSSGRSVCCSEERKPHHTHNAVVCLLAITCFHVCFIAPACPFFYTLHSVSFSLFAPPCLLKSQLLYLPRMLLFPFFAQFHRLFFQHLAEVTDWTHLPSCLTGKVNKMSILNATFEVYTCTVGMFVPVCREQEWTERRTWKRKRKRRKKRGRMRQAEEWGRGGKCLALVHKLVMCLKVVRYSNQQWSFDTSFLDMFLQLEREKILKVSLANVDISKKRMDC